MIKDRAMLKFIGKDSLGYEHGKNYLLLINDLESRKTLGNLYTDCPVVIERLGRGGLCPYTSWETFFNNWVKPTQQDKETKK